MKTKNVSRPIRKLYENINSYIRGTAPVWKRILKLKIAYKSFLFPYKRQSSMHLNFHEHL